MVKIVKYSEAEQVPFNFEARKMCIRKDAEIIRMTLAPSEKLPQHSNPFDVAIYVISGRGIFISEEMELPIAKDQCIEVERNKNRGILNTGESDLNLLVIKFIADS
jgi:quercetin dioxygenase-like cupin family protein